MKPPEFTIFPAIDLRRGSVVRLRVGDPDQQTDYSSDPLAVVDRWISIGARWIHVVNLDAAFGENDTKNQKAISQITAMATRNKVAIQLGGGLRSIDSLSSAFDCGITRVVIGTALIEQPTLLPSALEKWGASSIAAGIDAREGRVQIRGWQSPTPLFAIDLAISLANLGLRWMVYTDINRDGTGQGANLEETASIANRSGLQVIASGGFAALEEVRKARALELSGVILGRSLYEGQLSLADCLEV